MFPKGATNMEKKISCGYITSSVENIIILRNSEETKNLVYLYYANKMFNDSCPNTRTLKAVRRQRLKIC